MTQDDGLSQQLRAQILALTQARGPMKSICPSEAARAVRPHDWRALMPQVRDIAFALWKAGHIEICQGGIAIEPSRQANEIKGPVRLRQVAPPHVPGGRSGETGS